MNESTPKKDEFDISDIVDKDSFSDGDISSQLDQMHAQMVCLCRQLDRNVIDSLFDPEGWVNQLRAYIEGPSNRLLYNDISNYIFSKSSKEYGSMTTNLDKVMDYCVRNLSPLEKDKIVYKTVLKFYDHVNLACKQKEMFDADRDVLRKEIEAEVKQEISNATKDVTSQLVGLVALFTAMSFIVFGGIASLDGIFQSANCFMEAANSVLPTLITAVAWAFCMMNLLFGFMYFVLRLVKPDQFSRNPNLNFVQKFPVVVLTNYVLVVMFLLFGGMWFAKYNGIGLPIFNIVISHPAATFWIGIIVMVGLFIGLGLYLRGLYRDTSKSIKSLDEKRNS